MRKIYYIENKLNTTIKIPQLNLEFKPKEIKAVDGILIHRYMHKIRKALLLGQIKFTTRDRYLFFKKKRIDLIKDTNTPKEDVQNIDNVQQENNSTKQDTNSKKENAQNDNVETKNEEAKKSNTKKTTTKKSNTKKTSTKKSNTKKEESE